MDISGLIAACEWDTARWFIFSDNVFANYIYYSHLVPAIVALFFGLLVFFNNNKGMLNRILLFICLSFATWSILDLILWATDKPEITMFTWSILIYFDVFIYVGTLLLVQAFVHKKLFSFKTFLFIAALFIPLFLFSHTPANLLGFDLSNCDREALEGPLWHYAYAIEAFMLCWMAVIGVRAYKSNTNPSVRKQVLLISLGAFFLLMAFSFGNITGSIQVDWDLSQFGLFGMPVFITFLAYMIVRFRSFNVKILGAQMLTFALVFLLLGLLFIREIQNVRIVVFITLFFVALVGYLLIRGVKREIMQREKLERLTHQLEEANEKLKGLDKLKTEFLSLASHQLRSPLTAIKGYASMLLEGSFGDLNKEPKEAVNRIYLSSQNLVKVVEDLLNVSKIEQGGMKYEMMDTDVEKMLRELQNELSVPAQAKNLELSFSTDHASGYITNADPIKIRQVFLNLVDNAIKYTKEGFVKVSLSKKEGKLLIAIEDSGMGMNDEIKGKLFQKFSRGEGGKVNTGGSGLGLYLAKEIVEAHKGRVWVESPGLGKGSTFYVELNAA